MYPNPYKNALLGSIGYVYLFRRKLLTALAIPFIPYAVLDYLLESNLSRVNFLFVTTLYIFFHSTFAVITHRIILLGPESVPKWGILMWSRREVLFFRNVIICGALASIPTLPIYRSEIGAPIGILINAWILGRLSVVFPATAIDNEVSIRESWAVTRGHDFLMLFVVLFYPALLLVPAAFISEVPAARPVASLLATFTTIFTIAALSVTYQQIIPKTSS